MEPIASITSARGFFDRVVKPDYEEFTSKPTDLRKAFHIAVSLYHVREWIFSQYRGVPAKVFNCSNSNSFFSHLAGNVCSDLNLVRDIANSQKHFRLTQGSPQVNTATQTVTRSTGWGELPYGEGPYGGTPTVVVELNDGTVRAFSAIAKNVFHMWEQLFQTQGW